MKFYCFIFVLLLGFGFGIGEETCATNYFSCTDKQRCISKAFVCDDFPNCLDKSDEDKTLCEDWSYDYVYEETNIWGDEEEEEETKDDKDPWKKDNKGDSKDDFGKDAKSGETTSVKDTCSLNQCKPTGPISFQDGREYRYSYELLTKTEAIRGEDGAENQTSSSLVTCDVTLQILTACEMYIKVTNVASKSSSTSSGGLPSTASNGGLSPSTEDENVEFLRAIENQLLRFSMLGGEIDFVCPLISEDKRALNFKRGILSLLQNTMPKLHISHTQIEKDVVGECEMNYQFEGSNGARTVVSKTRDLQSCKSRSHITSMAQGVPYDFPLDSNPLQVIESKSKCTQEIKLGIILGASCEETHDLTPFRSDQGRITTTINQKLTYVSEGLFLPKWTPIEWRTDLVFEHEVSSSGGNSQDVFVPLVNSLLDKIGEPYDTSDSENRSPSSDFKLLVTGLRQLSLEQLLTLNKDRDWKDTERQHFYDAISMVGTASSVGFMAAEMPTLPETDSKDSVVKSWIKSLRQIQSPDMNTITAVTDILKIDSVPYDVYLSVGSLLNTYCLSQPTCQTHEPVISLMSHFEQVIKSGCKTKTSKDKLKVLFALRGLGNAGLAANSMVIDVLNKCISEEGNEGEVTATAIDAFRRIPCNVSRSSLETILTDQTRDSELRILSYLGLMKCANYETLHLVEDLFRNEQVNQVGSFIWTHLTNLQESSVPSKIDLQSLLSNRIFEEKFKSDFRKYSKNIEMSGFYDPLNVGGSAESNIIFSEKSYVPRQTSLNFTADLFGRSYNLFEIGARFEGFEKYLEHLLGSLHPPPEAKDIKNKNIKGLLKQTDRRKEYLQAEPEVSVNLRTFGNDFSYQHLHGTKELSSLLNTFNVQTIVQSLQQGKKFSLKKSYLPLDSTFEIATSGGLPLRLSIEGSAAVDTSIQFQLDVTGILQGKAMLKGHFKPNLSVNLRTSMIVDGYSSSTGIEMDSSFHSSVMVDGVVEIDGKNAISVDFNLPQDKMDIFKFSSRLAVIHGSQKVQENYQDNREEVTNPLVTSEVSSDCLLMDYAFGIKLCYYKQHPVVENSPLNHRSLLNGPIKYNLELVKKSPKLSSYKFRYRWNNDDKNLIFFILYDTPGSVPQGKHSFKIEINYENSEAFLNFNTPSKSLDAKGQYIWTPEVKRLNASLNYDGQGEALIDVGYKVHERNGQRIVIPILQVNWKNNQLVTLKGNLEARGRAEKLDIIHYGVDLQFVVEPAATGAGGQRVEGIIKGFLNKNNNDWKLSLDISYIFPGALAWETTNIYYERVMQMSDQLLKMIRSWKISFSQFPHLNTKGSWASKNFAGSTENAIKASFGSNYENPLNEVDLFQSFIYGVYEPIINATIAIKYPKKQLDVKVGADLFHDIRDLNTGFVFQYASGKAITSRLHVIQSTSGPMHTEGSYTFIVPEWIDLRAKGQIKQTEIDTYEIDFEGSANSKRLELVGYYTNLSTRLKQLHKLELKIKLPSRDIVYSNSTLLYDNNQFAAAVQVKTKDGSKYKVRVAYISQVDDFSAHQRKVEFDLHLPQRSYYWHSEITFGKYITISNDIHLDSYRDINLWIQLHKEENNPTEVKVKLYWDANRDPHKKATLQVTVGEKSADLISSIVFFGNEYKFTWRSSKDLVLEDNRLASWTHNHAGELSWNDNRREVHRITFGGNFNLIRKDGEAKLRADAYLRTPLETWKDNTIRIEYARSAEQIVVSLNSKWHKDEFLNLNFNSGLIRIEKGLKIESKIEVLSFINDNTVTFSTGAYITKKHRNLDGSIFIKWDKDEVKFLIEARNDSTEKDIQMSALGKILTTLKGYKHLSASLDLLATSGSLLFRGSTEWEDVVYELKCNGVLYSAMEYLKGEVHLTTPQYGPDTAAATIRVYHDPHTHDEKLQLNGHWLNEELEINGRVLAQPKDFRAELNIDIPFLTTVSQASMSLGHSTKDYYMSEVWFKWNNTKDLGLKVISRLDSLTDFLMSLAIKTPLTKYKELQVELKNLFELSPSVDVNSMIYGQLDNKKYGLGAIYKQGISPKLRVGLELYYPSPGLEEVKFDIGDYSTDTNMRYNFELKHGKDKQIDINTDFKKTEDSVEFLIGSGITLSSILGPGFEKVNFEGETKVYWEKPLGFQLRLGSRTPHNTNKVSIKGSLGDTSGFIEGNLALPYKHLEDFEYYLRFQKPDHNVLGALNVKITTGRMPLFTLDCQGNLDQAVSLKFTTAIENYRRGHLEYKLTAEDVERSKVLGSCSLEAKEIQFQGYVYIYEDQSVKLEIDATTPFKGYETSRLTLASERAEEGIKDKVTFSTGDMSYEGEILRDFDKESEWMFRASIINMKEEMKSYFLSISYKARSGDPIMLSFKAKTPHENYKLFSGLIKIQKIARPYDIALEWEIPTSSGQLDLVLESFSNEKILGSASLSLDGQERAFQSYTMKLQLDNRSTRDEVDLGLYTEIISTLKEYDHIIVDGTLRQVSSKPGLLQVYLVWPQMDPVNFTATASYSGLPSFDLRASANLNITSAIYGIIGEVQREDTMLNLKSGLFWQKGKDFTIQKITFLSSFQIEPDSLSGYSELRLPMVQGFEVNKADINYKRVENLKTLSVALEAGKTRTSVEAALNSNNLPAAEGNITIASSEFREGNPLILTFNQALTSDGYKGEYEFEWPVWDLKTRSYGREFVRAILNHSYLPKGQEGVLQLLSPLTKGKPISLSYSFVFPKKPDLTIKFGISYENIKFEIKLGHEVAQSANKQIRKSSVEFDNLIWPFGIAYLETISLHNPLDKETNDVLMIYDLEKPDRRSSLSLIRRFRDPEGSRFSIKGILVEREIEFSVGYKTSEDSTGGDVLLSWAPNEKIQCDFDWKLKSSTPRGKSYLLKARIAHPLRTVLLETIYIQGEGNFDLDLTLNTNLEDSTSMPLKIILNYENKKLDSSDKNIAGSFKISHPSLENEIYLSAEYQRQYLYPLLLKLLLQYSPDPKNDLSLTAQVKRDEKENTLEDLFEITHQSSKLHAKANGKLKYGSSIYSFDQMFSYTKEDGQVLSAKLDGGVDLIDKSIHTQVESSERLLDLKLKISEKEKGHWELITTSETHDSLPLSTSLQLHPSQPIFVLTVESLKPLKTSDQRTFVEDSQYPRFLAKKVILEGGLEDQRFAHLSMKHLPPSVGTDGNDTQSWTLDLDFAFKLNNSRLISAYVDWRKRIEQELKNEVQELMGMTQEFRADAKEWIRTAVTVAGSEAVKRAKPIFKDVVTHVKPLLSHFKNESIAIKGDFYLLFKNINITKNEKNLKESVQFAISNIVASLSQLKIVEKLKERLAQGTLRSQVTNLIQKIKDFLGSILDKDPSLGKLISKVKEFASSFASTYDNAVKKWYLVFRNAVDDFKMRLSDWLRTKWHTLYNNYKPHILSTLHHVEAASYAIISQVWDSMNKLGANFKSLSYVQMLEQIYGKLKSIYDDMSKRSLRQNLEWVYQYTVTYVKKGVDAFFARVLPFIDDWIEELKSAWEKFTSYESIRSAVDFCSTIGQTITWTLQKVDFSDFFLDAMAFSIEHGYTILTQTGIEAQLRNINPKTDLSWVPAKGEIKFVQKLPFEWNRFNEGPAFKELLQIPYVAPLRNLFFSSSKFSLLDSWYRYFNLNFQPLSWIPPFSAVGYVVGENHILTFDGKLIEFKGTCEHLLTADLVHHNWAASVKFNKYTPKTINVYIEGKVIELSKQLKVKINGKLSTVPLSLGTTYLWRSHGSIHLEQKNGIELTWNLVHDVLSIRVPKESFMNTVGLLGTNNNEVIDDLLMPDGTRWNKMNDIKKYVDSWKIDDKSCQSEQEMTSLEEPVTSSICEELFKSKASPFKYCFHHVNPDPYYEMCLNGYKGNIKDTSASALAFRERCTENAVPVKLPVEYVKCEYTNASSNSLKKLQEGQTVILNKEDIENAVDVVIVVELKECNKKKLRSKNFHNFITMFNDGLIKEGVQSTRFALVSYGGIGYNERPSIVSSDTEIFTTSKNIANYLENLEFDSDNRTRRLEDNEFGAILYSLNNIAFRSPVNVIFALFPCTPCHNTPYSMDFPTMYHTMLDNSASLYVFKNDYFDIPKESMKKKIIGYDKDVAYTIKDQTKKKMGESALKKQITPPKLDLDVCLPLALETNGMVLTSEFLMESKKRVERLGLIAGRRAGQNSKAESAQRCLCLSTQEVTPDLRCDKWDHGDFSVLERYGLNLDSDSSVFSNVENDKRKGFYD